MNRQTLVFTSRAKLLVLVGYGAQLVYAAAIAVSVILSPSAYVAVIVTGVVLYPVFLPVAYSIIIAVANLVIAKPQEKKLMQRSKEKLKSIRPYASFRCGSYGKTNKWKELPVSVLQEVYIIKATPGNGNTPSAQWKFIDALDGDEDVLIFELGEGKPGDVLQFKINAVSGLCLSSQGSRQTILTNTKRSMHSLKISCRYATHRAR